MSDLNLGAVLRSFRRSAWRLEARDHYESAPEHRALAEWRARRPVPPRTDGWLELVTDHVRAGRSIGRVHVVSRPLSEYVQFELALYAQHTAVGEQVAIADRSLDRDHLATLRQDFWIFDETTVALMHYDDAGRFLQATDASDHLEEYLHLQQMALNAAVPLHAWIFPSAAVVGE